MIEVEEVVNLADFQSFVEPQEIAPTAFEFETYLKNYAQSNFRLNYFVYNNWLNLSFSKEMWWVDLIFWKKGDEFVLVFYCEDYCGTEKSLVTNYTLTSEECKILNLALHNPKMLKMLL